MQISSTVKTVLIIAAAIVLAWIALKVVAVVLSVVSFLITVAIMAVVVYIVYLVARSAVRNRKTA